MTPASKGAQVKRAPASRSAATPATVHGPGTKSPPAKVAATATKRPALTKKKAVPVVKKAATADQEGRTVSEEEGAAATQEDGAPAKKPARRQEGRPGSEEDGPGRQEGRAGQEGGSAASGGREAGRQGRRPRHGRVRRQRWRGGPHAPSRPSPSRHPRSGPRPGPTPRTPSSSMRSVSCCRPTGPSTRSRRPPCAPRRTRWRSSGSPATSSSTRSRAKGAPSRSTVSGTWPSRDRPCSPSRRSTTRSKRIDDKTYGYCERCFQPIPKPRLRALPYARLCVACKSGGLSRR